MNTETAAIYEGEEAIAAARARGEPLAMVSERVVKLIRLGEAAERRIEHKRKKKAKRKMAEASRRANRR